MMTVKFRCVATFALVLAICALARPALAQSGARVEIGTSLTDLTVLLPPGGGNHEVLFGVPSGTLGLFTPSVYLSFFASRHLAVEPRIGLLVESAGGHTDHLLNAGADIAFFGDAERSSAYVFAGVGVIDISGGGSHPKNVSGGAGYRIRAGDRLAFRLSGRFIHFTNSGGNAVAFAIAIGGLIGGR